MARYYFDILDGAQIVRDDEGSEFDSPDAARASSSPRGH